MSRNSRVEFGEREYIREGPRRGSVRDYDEVDVRIREREQDRLPAFMREDNRRAEPGPMVLRQREVETIERPRQRSPSPARIRERIVQRARSVSPGPGRMDEEVRFRRVVREQSRGPAERIRFVSPPSRSPSPEVQQRIRIVEREKERSPSPSPPPRPPTPKIIKGPTIEREVITHYRDIDHGIVQVRPPSPPPPPRQKHQHRDTEIDIYTSRNDTEVDIHRRAHSHNRGRSPSRERKSRQPARQQQTWDDEVTVQAGRKHLEVDIERRRSVSRGRRAQSAAPPSKKSSDYDDEAYEITSKIDKRGRMGEAWNGITKDWAIIDVPPGTERVRMDGAGGASAEVTWQKYSGVRRAKFIPEREREEKSSVASASTSVSELRAHGGGERERHLSVQIVDKDRGGGSREREVEVEKVTDRRIAIRGQTPPPPPRRTETWTEITKDLVCREAIQELGYDFEETEFFYYIVEYLAYEDVLRLVQVSDRIRAARKERAREIAYEREWRDDWEIRSSHHHHHGGHGRRRSSHRYSVDFVDDERVVEREVVYDSRKGYRH